MSKHTLFLFALLTGSIFSAYSQSKKDSVARYYQLKNGAELSIIDSNYAAALEGYHKAFTYKKPNARELYNAFVAAYLIKDRTDANQYFDQMVLYGLNKASFERSKYFGSKIAEEPLYKDISRDYDSLKSIADKTGMPAIAKVMDSLLTADQAVRNENSQKMGVVDSINRDYLLSFIQKRGFPCFETTGFYDRMMGSQANGPTTFWFLMWHARYGGGTVLDSVMKQAVAAGDFPPEDYALLMDVYKDDNRIYFQIMPHQVVNKETVLMMPAQRDAADKKRAEIFLDNLSDYSKKLEFAEHGDKRFQFLPVMGLALVFAK